MSLTLTYKNDFGAVTINSTGKGAVRLCGIDGLGIASNEYITAVYTGQDGQSTLSARALPRRITLALEITGNNVSDVTRDTLKVLSRQGMLYIESETLSRRIQCNQVQIPDIDRILKGKISTIAVQFVCDNPYFEDGEDTVLPLYGRYKKLETPFSMPCVFGEIIAGAQIENVGDLDVEPQITLYYPDLLENAENVTVTNTTTGKSICLDYAPKAGDIVVIDVKSRTITSSASGNLLNYISADTFLGDFVLKRGINRISVSIGDVTSGFAVQCRYSNLYQEAVIA